eukprot:PhF_6_TR17306/c0_g1_i1/m.26529/K05755/ARPC4; actin related protein 2/3 complex, subunit 4
MSTAAVPYHNCVRATLTAALSLRSFPSSVAERHNKPEVEAAVSPELILNPITICRDDQERVYIEPSINSVRVSIRFRKSDSMEEYVAQRYTAFVTERAEQFFVLRRKPLDGYDISFLVTNDHTETMLRSKIVDFILQFMSDIDKDLKDIKLQMNQRFRKVATEWFTLLN